MTNKIAEDTWPIDGKNSGAIPLGRDTKVIPLDKGANQIPLGPFGRKKREERHA